MTSLTNLAIGIDIGTTYSCVAVIKNGKAKIISNPEGYKKTPSVVGFRNNERFVGNPAKNQAALNSTNTIFNIKRFIGRRYDDHNMKADAKNMPFRTLANYPSPVIEVDFAGGLKKFTPEEITSIILQKMKNSAERYLGHDVRDAVITVPACFNDRQRQATKDAAEIAGLNVLRLLNEPTAAALTFAVEKGVNKTQKILILDFGGGTFDVSIVKFTSSDFPECMVIASSGDAYLGGTDFDERLIEYFAKEFNKKHNADMTKNPRSMQRLRNACELSKIRLSTNIDAPLEVDALFEGIDFYTQIARAKFEELCDDLLLRIFTPIKKVLQYAKMDKSEVDDILLVGGSTRIPKLHRLLENFFDVQGLNNYVNADEACAYGAAVQAALLTKSDKIERISVFQKLPINIYINFRGGKSKPKVVRQNPAEFAINYENYGKKDVVFEASEEKRDAAGNHYKLGKFMLETSKFHEHGEVTIDVKFEINDDGILTASAYQQSTGEVCSVKRKNGQLSRNDIEIMIEMAQSYEREDLLLKERVEARNEFEQFIYKMRDVVEESSVNISDDGIEKFQKIRRTEIDWLEDNENATKEEIRKRLKTFEEACRRLIEKKPLFSEKQFIEVRNVLDVGEQSEDLEAIPADLIDAHDEACETSHDPKEDKEFSELIDRFGNLSTENDTTPDSIKESNMEDNPELSRTIVTKMHPLQNVL